MKVITIILRVTQMKFTHSLNLQVHSAKVRARAARERLRSSSYAPSETANLLAVNDSRRNGPKRMLQMAGEAFVFLLHNTLGYALMLSVMIYNGYLFVMVVLGMGLGYFMFGHISMRVNMENMQARTTKVICTPACPDGMCEPRNSVLCLQTLIFHITHSDPSVASTSSATTSSGHCQQITYNTTLSTVLPPFDDGTSSHITDSCRL